jgi:hypothetical protein
LLGSGEDGNRSGSDSEPGRADGSLGGACAYYVVGSKTRTCSSEESSVDLVARSNLDPHTSHSSQYSVHAVGEEVEEVEEVVVVEEAAGAISPAPHYVSSNVQAKCTSLSSTMVVGKSFPTPLRQDLVRAS